jgi:hypothetical protein
MRTMKTSTKITMAMFTLGIGAAALAQAGRTLILNGQVASHDVRLIGGRPYVPLADIARALGQRVVPASGGYEITAAGGANQVEGLRGKIGDVLFDGKWRFQVLDVKEMDSYTMKNHSTNDYGVYHSTAEFTDETLRPKPGNSLIVIQCRLKNGVKQNQALWRYNPDTHTALTDDQGQSYPPIAYDIPDSGSFNSRDLLPGAALDFAVLFTVPPGTHLKDLVFTLRTLSNKGDEVRVSVAQ